MNRLYDTLKAKYGDALPETMPDHWRFNTPPVCTAYWDAKDWVAYAAPLNGFPLNNQTEKGSNHGQ